METASKERDAARAELAKVQAAASLVVEKASDAFRAASMMADRSVQRLTVDRDLLRKAVETGEA